MRKFKCCLLLLNYLTLYFSMQLEVEDEINTGFDKWLARGVDHEL